MNEIPIASVFQPQGNFIRMSFPLSDLAVSSPKITRVVDLAVHVQVSLISLLVSFDTSILLPRKKKEKKMSCGSRLSYLDEIAWTWQDGRLLALCLCAIGLLGAFLNGLVLIGVGGNAKLGTTVNKLLIWICTIAILESFVGILVKALILGK